MLSFYISSAVTLVTIVFTAGMLWSRFRMLEKRCGEVLEIVNGKPDNVGTGLVSRQARVEERVATLESDIERLRACAGI